MRLTNYAQGQNGRALFTRDFVVWFSYETPIGFHTLASGLVIRENDWGPTTGKHLNAIPDQGEVERVSSERFEALFEEHIGARVNAS